MTKYQLKIKAVSMYYGLRAAGLNHSQAMGIVIDFVISATVPKVAAPAKQARVTKGKRKAS